MTITHDIETRADVELLVNNFYAAIQADKTLGHIFNNVAQVNWSTHLPAMYDFWENIILFTGSYEGNPMQLHKHLHKIVTLKKAHFTRWNKLFIKSVDDSFAGNNAALAKAKALSISAVLRNKIFDKPEEAADSF